MKDPVTDLGEAEYSDLELAKEKKEADYEKWDDSELLDELKRAIEEIKRFDRGEIDRFPKRARLRADLLIKEYRSRPELGDEAKKIADIYLWDDWAERGPQGNDAVIEAILFETGLNPELGSSQGEEDILKDPKAEDFPDDEGAMKSYRHTSLRNRFRRVAGDRPGDKRGDSRQQLADPLPPESEEDQRDLRLDNAPDLDRMHIKRMVHGVERITGAQLGDGDGPYVLGRAAQLLLEELREQPEKKAPNSYSNDFYADLLTHIYLPVSHGEKVDEQSDFAILTKDEIGDRIEAIAKQKGEKKPTVRGWTNKGRGRLKEDVIPDYEDEVRQLVDWVLTSPPELGDESED